MKWSRRWASCLVMCVLVFPQVSLARKSDPETLRVQESLRDCGHDPGPVDGIMGKKTRKALRAFQRGLRLPATGIVDVATRAALQGAGAADTEPVSQSPEVMSPSAKVAEPEAPPLTMAVVPLVYKPPQRGTPGSRVAAAVRGEGDNAPLLYALIPDGHIGLTTQEQPVLYWYLSEPTKDRIELTIVDERDLPVFEGVLASPTRAGIQEIRLADHDVQLAVGPQYKWFVSIVPKPDSPSHNIVVGGGIQRIEPSEALNAQLAQAEKESIPAFYAEAGLWYDALTGLGALIDATPGDARFRTQRAVLLAQVGLQAVAAQER